jgi:hypothetical protein
VSYARASTSGDLMVSSHHRWLSHKISSRRDCTVTSERRRSRCCSPRDSVAACHGNDSGANTGRCNSVADQWVNDAVGLNSIGTAEDLTRRRKNHSDFGRQHGGVRLWEGGGRFHPNSWQHAWRFICGGRCEVLQFFSTWVQTLGLLQKNCKAQTIL